MLEIWSFRAVFVSPVLYQTALKKPLPLSSPTPSASHTFLSQPQEPLEWDFSQVSPWLHKPWFGKTVEVFRALILIDGQMRRRRRQSS